MSLLRSGTAEWTSFTERGRAIEHEIRILNQNLKVEPAVVRRQWLQQQWDRLEQTDPQIDLPYRGTEPATVRRALIDPEHIVDVTGAGHRWRDLPTRGVVFEQLLEGLQDAAAVHRWDDWIDSIAREHDLIEIRAETGPLGPLYAVRGQGRRRAMLAKALQLPLLDVRLTTRPLPSPENPIRWPAHYMPDDDWTARHYLLLIEEGLITVHQEQTPTGGQVVIAPLTEVDAAWTFDPPRILAATTAKYRWHYPGFTGLTLHVEHLAQRSSHRSRILSGKKASWSDSKLGGKRAR